MEKKTVLLPQAIAMFMLYFQTVSFTQVTLSGEVLFPEGVDCTPGVTYTNVPDVFIEVESLGSSASDTMTTDANGEFTLEIPAGMVRMAPSIAPPAGRPDWVEGLTALDNIYIQQHQTKINPIDCPFKRIAGDVNNDAKLDTNDQSIISQLILGTIDSFTNVPNWRFVSKSYASPRNTHPDLKFVSDFWNNDYADANGNEYPFNAELSFDGYLSTYNDSLSWMEDVDRWEALEAPSCDPYWGFYIVKSGDTNGSADIYEVEPPPMLSLASIPGPHQGNGRNAGGEEPLTFSTEAEVEETLNSSRNYLFTIKAFSPEPVFGYQMGIRFNPLFLEFVEIRELSDRFNQRRNRDFNLNQPLLNQGALRTLWVFNGFEEAGGIITEEPLLLFSMVINTRQEVTGLLNHFYLDDSVLENAFYNASAEIQGVEVFIEYEEYFGN